jgi:hypothetical protein
MHALILQVVLLWNLDVQVGLANGTRGVVERLASVREYLAQEGLVLHDTQHQQQYRSPTWRQAGTSSWHNQQQQQPAPLQQQQQQLNSPPYLQQQQWKQQHHQQQQYWGSPPYLQQQQRQQQQPITPPPPPPPAAGALPRYNEQQVQHSRVWQLNSPLS